MKNLLPILKKSVFWLTAGFVLLFACRLTYGYLYPQGAARAESYTEAAQEFEFDTKNYASERKKLAGNENAAAVAVDQKYEKVASLGAQTQTFDEDEKQVREAAARHQSLIQYEQSYGLAGRRRLNLAIGVPPEQFDAMVGEVKAIGSLLSIRVDKTDKTNEYKDLNAKRVSLEKTRDSLVALKARGGNIAESINLENRILEIETQIQALGVSLGEYDKENEFCTVKVTLEEQPTAAATAMPFLQRIKVALEWTIKYYLGLLAILLLMLAVGYATTLLLERLRETANVTRPLTEKKGES